MDRDDSVGNTVGKVGFLVGIIILSALYSCTLTQIYKCIGHFFGLALFQIPAFILKLINLLNVISLKCWSKQLRFLSSFKINTNDPTC